MDLDMKVSKYNTSVLLHDVGQAQARKSQVSSRDYPHQILEELFYQEDNVNKIIIITKIIGLLPYLYVCVVF